LSSEISIYKTSSTESDSLKKAHLQEIINLTVGLGLDGQVNMSLAGNESTVDEFLEELDDVLSALKSLSMPCGLHVLGEAPKGEALVGMVNSMLGDNYSEMVAVYNDSDSAANDLLSLVILENMSVTGAQEQILRTSTKNIETRLNTSIIYNELIAEADNEVRQVLNAMDGKYIEANLGGDPVLRPETLPSGRNFYAFDEQLIPTKQAWEEGTTLIAQWLDEYHEENKGYPGKVAYILWAGESTRHEGITEAQILYLLGVEPVWGSGNKVTGIQLINSSELKRPRIDVTVQVSGLYRDTFPMKIELIDRAVRLAYQQDEADNYVRENTNSLQAVLNKTILDRELALDIAQFRIFGPADGAYGTGMANTVESSDTWNNNTKLAELYISKMCYVYGENIWGQTLADYIERQTGQNLDINNSLVFESNLNGTQAIFHSRSSNTYGSLDTNDFFQYLGGLYNAINFISGIGPDTYVVNLQDLDDMKIETLRTYIENELYARYFNPTWISGMQGNGYEGAAEMEDFLANLWGWEALNPDLISDRVWDMVYGTYVTNPELSGWLKENNPYAYQSMLARLTETARKKSWSASDKVIQNLVKEYVESVVESGVTCCHHTCGNPLLDNYIRGVISAPNAHVVDANVMKDYKRLMAKARGETLDTDSPEGRKHSSSSGAKAKTVSKEESHSENANSSFETGSGIGTDLREVPTDKANMKSNYVEGYEMTKEKIKDKMESESMPFSASDILGMLFLLLLVGAIFVGYGKKRR
ncbi:MAG: cobaltochelatase subunit CobN, partial [Methanosarcinaceae archaeon]|nr:cobaltochelatase subunit CobN [Methanosarcinaceae archaeon]